MALAALILLAGCAGVHRLGAQATPTGVVPWLPLPPNTTPAPEPSPPPPTPIPPGTPACTADQLQGAEIGRNGATGHLLVGFAFSGRGQSNCYLLGTPSVALFDAAGHSLAFKLRTPDLAPTAPNPVLVEPGPAPEAHDALKLGQAGLTIEWVTQPEQCPGEKPVLVAVARIAIPGGGTLAVNVPEEPAAYPCQGLGVGAFEGPYMPVEVISPPLPAVALQVPASVRVGHPLDYRVTLTNHTADLIDLLTLCPIYDEELRLDPVHGSPPLGGKHLYQLNCAPAGTLQPGASATFQMIFDVPGDAAPGEYTLIFMLQFQSWPTPTAQAKVTLTQ